MASFVSYTVALAIKHYNEQNKPNIKENTFLSPGEPVEDEGAHML